MKIITALLCCAALLGVTLSDSINLEQLKVIQTKLQDMIKTNPELMADWVQLSFHDCFGSEGCNGCLDLQHPSNKGLMKTIENSKKLHNEIASKMSLADFIALLGTEGAKAGAAAAGGRLMIPFSVGRVDCYGTPSDSGLPFGFQTNTIELLRTQFGLTTKEVVALMGAHSLGRAKIESTGFKGPWDRSEFKLDTGYYRAMVAPIWEVEKLDNENVKSSQWSAKEGFLMLHADMILLKKFSLAGDFDEPNCTFQTCPEQESTAKFVKEFADIKNFHRIFSRAFLKMINKSNGYLTRLETD